MSENHPAPMRSNGAKWAVDTVMALMMGAMFAVFILQVITRYLAKYQLAGDFTWTLEFCTALFVWILFFGGAFVLTETDHVKFDMIYNLFGERAQRWLSIATSVAIVALFVSSLPATWKYLSFLFRLNKSTNTLKIPFTGLDVPVYAVYSILLAFWIAMIVRYTIRAVRLIMGATPNQLDPPMIADEEKLQDGALRS